MRFLLIVFIALLSGNAFPEDGDHFDEVDLSAEKIYEKSIFSGVIRITGSKLVEGPQVESTAEIVEIFKDERQAHKGMALTILGPYLVSQLYFVSFPKGAFQGDRIMPIVTDGRVVEVVYDDAEYVEYLKSFGDSERFEKTVHESGFQGGLEATKTGGYYTPVCQPECDPEYCQSYFDLIMLAIKNSVSGHGSGKDK